jgi:nucleotide-binding universal stress UspA family protein
MPAPIIVGFDAHRADATPVRFALSAARYTGAALVVAAVHAGHSHPHLEGGLPDDAGGPLTELRQQLAADDAEIEYLALPGASAARALHSAAEERGAGLLVVGASGGGELHGLLGSTAHRLLHGAGCPVAVVPPAWSTAGALKAVGVAYTDTTEGREALEAALGIARRSGATLRVLSAVKPQGKSESYGGAPNVESTSAGAVGGGLRADTELGIEAATKTVEDVQIDTDVSVQDPADFLIAASERLDLLVCGSRAYGPKRAVMLGGVSRRLTAEAKCPVIVLARGGGGLGDLLEAPPSYAEAR